MDLPRLVDRVGCFDVLADRVNGDEEEDEVRLREKTRENVGRVTSTYEQQENKGNGECPQKGWIAW